MGRYSVKQAVADSEPGCSEPRCLYDILREISLEFEIPEVSDINQINQCQLTHCSGRDTNRHCYKPCNYDPEAVKLDFKKALTTDETRKRRKNGSIKPATPRMILMRDMSYLCGDPVIDRFASSHYQQIDKMDESGDIEDN